MIRRFLAMVSFFLITAVVIPSVVFFVMETKNEEKKANEDSKNEISVFFADENKTRIMNIEDYLVGVVAAEMPAEFEEEALKAQAVAARSYSYYRMENPTDKHPDASVCTDFAHCKAYKSGEELSLLWKDKKDVYYKKVSDAVYATAGEIITYAGEVAMAVFHSQSGAGRTENSKDVWGGEVPYLISVESHGEELAPNFYSSATFSIQEFREKLAKERPDIKIDSVNDIMAPQLSEGGSVSSIEIGGKTFSGREIRTIFNLRSSCFDIKADDQSVSFEVTGYGHGVGMSQYGANTMAKEGYNYVDILTHYYSGTQISGV